MREQGLGDPLHHNYWPYQIAHYAKLGWFNKVGYITPSGGGSHAVAVAQWEVGKRI